MEYFELNNGNKLPKICFGPGVFSGGLKFFAGYKRVFNKIIRIKRRIDYLKGITTAFQSGISFIDYSAAYGREDLIAKAIKKNGIKRENVFLTTRVTNKSQFDDNVRDDALRSIEKLKVDYVDLLMFHWPVPEKFVSTWETLIKLQEEGYAKNIGVANCHEHHLEKLISATSVVPQVNQVEIHPLFSQKKLIGYCQSKKIQVEAYTSLGRMDERMTRLPLMRSLCAKYQKNFSQLILRWHIQNGIIPVFRSFNAKHQKDCIDIFDFEISNDDMKLIDSININSRLRYDPDNCDFTIL